MAEYCAGMDMETAVTLYARLFVFPNPVIAELFAMEGACGHFDEICWVREEATVEQFHERHPQNPFVFEEGDRVFFFRSSDASWKQLCGWEGFFIVRGSCIVNVHYTAINRRPARLLSAFAQMERFCFP